MGSMIVVGVARAAYGGALLAFPDRIVAAFGGGDPPDPAAGLTARVIGGRHVLQAVVTGRRPGPVRRYGGALVDLAHAASMLAFSRDTDAPGERRRPALVDGCIAAAFCVAGLVAGRGRDE